MDYRNFRKIPGTKLCRGSRPDDLNQEQRKTLENEYGIKCIVDLRSPKESAVFRRSGFKTLKNQNFINIIPERKWASVLWKEAPWYLTVLYIIFLPLIQTIDVLFNTILNLRVVQVYATLRGGLYGYSCDIIQHCGDEINRALTLLCSEENTPALIVCNLGKDRTGLLVAIIQSLCGVSEETIAQDYSMSKGTGEHYYRRVGTRMMDANPETITKFLKFIDNKYGSLPSYLDRIGFNKKMQKQLVENVKEQNGH